jgi:ABC-type protease/lipase transport system fused ATPase/permease subunit
MKAAGQSIIIAHRPAAIQERDLLLMLENGQRSAFGPKDEVLKSVVKNHEQVNRGPSRAGGVA